MDIYEEYPELRDLKPRRTINHKKKKRRKRINNSVKLIILIVLIVAALFLMSKVLSAFSAATDFVYNRDGSVMEVKAAEIEKYISEGWFADITDTLPVKLYAEDGSCITAVRGDIELMQQKGYYADMSKAFSTVYSEDGKTLYVPNSMADTYKSKGWTDRLSDITTTLYKSDGSRITVMNAAAQSYIDKGWTDKLLNAAKKMASPDGEEKFVFNDEVDQYITQGWTVIKRVIDPDQPMIALTFDDGPGKYTEKLIKCLEDNNSAATFFVVGNLIDKYPDALVHANKIGCEIGNHTWEHTSLTSLSASQAAEVIDKTSEKVMEVIGKPTPIYRPVGGNYNDSVLKAIDSPAIMWSLDTLDWKTRNADSTYNKITANVKDGDIILMHDIYEPTVEAACKVIPVLLEQGYQLVTVSELLEYRYGEINSHTVYNSGR